MKKVIEREGCVVKLRPAHYSANAVYVEVWHPERGKADDLVFPATWWERRRGISSEDKIEQCINQLIADLDKITRRKELVSSARNATANTIIAEIDGDVYK